MLQGKLADRVVVFNGTMTTPEFITIWETILHDTNGRHKTWTERYVFTQDRLKDGDTLQKLLAHLSTCSGRKSIEVEDTTVYEF